MGLPKLALCHYAFCLGHIAQWTPESPSLEIERRLFSLLAPIHALSSNILIIIIKYHPIIYSTTSIMCGRSFLKLLISMFILMLNLVFGITQSYVLINIPFYGKIG